MDDTSQAARGSLRKAAGTALRISSYVRSVSASGLSWLQNAVTALHATWIDMCTRISTLGSGCKATTAALLSSVMPWRLDQVLNSEGRDSRISHSIKDPRVCDSIQTWITVEGTEGAAADQHPAQMSRAKESCQDDEERADEDGDVNLMTEEYGEGEVLEAEELAKLRRLLYDDESSHAGSDGEMADMTLTPTFLENSMFVEEDILSPTIESGECGGVWLPRVDGESDGEPEEEARAMAASGFAQVAATPATVVPNLQLNVGMGADDEMVDVATGVPVGTSTETAASVTETPEALVRQRAHVEKQILVEKATRASSYYMQI